MKESTETLKKRVKKLETENKSLQQAYNKVEETNQLLNDKVVEVYTLYNISKTLSTTLDLDQLFMLIMELFLDSFQLDEYAILLVNEINNRLDIHASYGYTKEQLEESAFFIDEDIFDQVYTTKETALIEDLSETPLFTSKPSLTKNEGSYICIPLIIQETRVIGMLTMHKPAPNSFEEKDINIFSSVADQIAISIDNAKVYQQTVEIAIKDELTKIYNRRYFNSRFEVELGRSFRYKRELGLMIIDIDHFKTFNDTHGHLIGDKVLSKVASVLKENLRTSDILARYGGEEFVVLLPETPKQYTIDVADKLRKNLKAEDFEGEETQPKGELTISVGVASFPSDTDKADPKTLIEMADQCLYRAKENGRDQIRYIDDTDTD